jgi:hypothetical protein
MVCYRTLLISRQLCLTSPSFRNSTTCVALAVMSLRETERVLGFFGFRYPCFLSISVFGSLVLWMVIHNAFMMYKSKFEENKYSTFFLH